jgi:hypothetical protein
LAASAPALELKVTKPTGEAVFPFLLVTLSSEPSYPCHPSIKQSINQLIKPAEKLYKTSCPFNPSIKQSINQLIKPTEKLYKSSCPCNPSIKQSINQLIKPAEKVL